MQEVILNYYVNEFRTYLFILKRVLYDVIWRQGENAVTFPHSAQQKYSFWGEIKKISKTKKLSPRKKVYLELLHHGLGHRYNR